MPWSYKQAWQKPLVTQTTAYWCPVWGKGLTRRHSGATLLDTVGSQSASSSSSSCTQTCEADTGLLWRSALLRLSNGTGDGTQDPVCAMHVLYQQATCSNLLAEIFFRCHCMSLATLRLCHASGHGFTFLGSFCFCTDRTTRILHATFVKPAVPISTLYYPLATPYQSICSCSWSSLVEYLPSPGFYAQHQNTKQQQQRMKGAWLDLFFVVFRPSGWSVKISCLS